VRRRRTLEGKAAESRERNRYGRNARGEARGRWCTGLGPTRSGVKSTKLQANSFHCITGIVLRRSRQSQWRRGRSVGGQASGREKVDDIYHCCSKGCGILVRKMNSRKDTDEDETTSRVETGKDG
jgi:hypothetical protein